MRKKVIAERLRERLKENPSIYPLARSIRLRTRGLLPRRRFEGIPGRIHPNDSMLHATDAAGVAWYASGARNVLALIERSLAIAGTRLEDVDAWLDLGCGYGRVLRFLVERAEPTKVWAEDRVDQAVRFCSSECHVHPINVPARRGQVRPDGYGFIYAISVLTHLPVSACEALLERLGRLLEPNGLLLFTTHGWRHVELLPGYDRETATHADEIRQRLAEAGAVFAPYVHHPTGDYGMTWHAPEFVQAAMSRLRGDPIEQLFFEPAGLDGHQDVFAYRRNR